MKFHPTSVRSARFSSWSIFVFTIALLTSHSAAATTPMTPRNLLAGEPELHQLGRDVPAVQAALVPPGAWHPFPRASAREAWTSIPASMRAHLLGEGEAAIAGEWPALRATDVLAYIRVGDRGASQRPRTERRQRLLNLVLAECVEGEGRFMDAIADGIWATCEETYWGLSAHVFMQRAGAGLPDVTEPTVDLGVSETSALLSWISYLLGPELDRVSPLLKKRIHAECERRLLSPCFDRADFWWMGWDTQGHPINNWNPWIVSNWLSTALLLETDPERRARHVEKAQRVLDIFINSYPEDGGCDEGPSYWGRAGASLFDALNWMHSASEGRISIFDHPLIHAMGRYIMTAHVSGNWFVNFADARARLNADGNLIYRYGRAVGDDELAQFGAWIWQNDTPPVPGVEQSLGRVLPQLFLAAELSQSTAHAPLPRDAWLPDLQFMVARDTAGSSDGFTLIAKGGHNDESHNHNDVGSFILYLDGQPLFIDAGPEAYTARTFSAERYDIWTMRSAWHNVPLINGAEQAAGRAHAAREVHYAASPEHATLALDLAATYPASAGVQRWHRNYDLHRGRSLRISDSYTLAAARKPNALHFLTNRAVDVSQPGIVRLGPFPGASTGRDAELHYDASALTPVIETKAVEDARLLDTWGPQVHLITLIERDPATHGSLAIEVFPVEGK